jgi:hypothetical protein
MASGSYLELTMNRLSNILYNASQSKRIDKNEILDSIKVILMEYKSASGSNINVEDFRNK